MRKFKIAEKTLTEIHRAVLDGKVGVLIDTHPYSVNKMQKAAQDITLLPLATSSRLRSVSARATGWANNSNRLVTWSTWALAQWTPRQIKVTTLHEYAHCLAPQGSGHNNVWRNIFRVLLNYYGLQGHPVEQCYSESQNRKNCGPAQFVNLIESCSTVEICMTVKRQIDTNTSGKTRTDLLNKLSAKLMELV